ncbi:MAG: chitobiase/beta-hexosaminidase C-terminal domain-containing protein [Butyrivibrio sp.]|nr:chitobiase/beta-hexosaminidase C-terminal domain-containing protein [Butyrivibrio sp.]
MKDDFDLEEELAKSIASIVDEETAGARAYVNKTKKNGGAVRESVTEEEFDDGKAEEDEETQKDGGGAKRVIIIVAAVLAAVAAIGVISYFAVTAALNKSRDNYGYYNKLGYEAYDKREYEDAIANFEKALTYSEGKTASETNINMMLYMYECYKAVKNEAKSEAILKNVLELDADNMNAYYNLVEVYGGRKDFEALNGLYEDAEATGDPDLKALFNKYISPAPSATPEGGSFTDDQKIFLTAAEGCKIYYTTDGSDPKASSAAKIFSERIEAGAGTTTVKFYSVNEYGFESDVMEAVYTVSYDGPPVPKISPQETSFSQSSKVVVTISNVSQGCKVYYTMDGNMPTEYSTEYSKTPIELPAGTTILTVLVVDEHGMTSTASRTYTVQYVSKYTEKEAEKFIWDALENGKIVDKDHYLIEADKKKTNVGTVRANEKAGETDGEKTASEDKEDESEALSEKESTSEKPTQGSEEKPKPTEAETKAKKKCSLDFYSQKLIDGKSIYMFYFGIDGETQSYWYGADADTGDVYKVTGSSDSYKLSAVK